MLGTVLAGRGGVLFGYDNGRHSVCQFGIGGQRCRVANDAWTAGLVLLVGRAVVVVASIILALTTEPRLVEHERYRHSLNLWIGLAILLAVIVVLVVVTVL